MQHCSIQAGLQIYGRQVTVAQKVRLQLGESDGNSADVEMSVELRRQKDLEGVGEWQTWVGG